MKNTYEKTTDGYILGVHISNTETLREVGQMILKKDAKSLNRFANDYLYYFVTRKLVS